MSRPACEIADIFRRYGPAFQAQYGRLLGPLHLLVLKALAACRTAQLGGHVMECDHCGHQKQAYNSCHNRHCPKCQASLRGKWFEERQRDLLPVEYYAQSVNMFSRATHPGTVHVAQQNDCTYFHRV